MKLCERWALSMALLLMMSSWCYAADEDISGAAYKVDRYIIGYTVNDDGTYVENREITRTVLNKKALSTLKQMVIYYTSTVQKAEVLEAYTRKPDGRRIDVPKSNFQTELSAAKNRDAQATSERAKLTIAFPEVDVADTLVVSYRLNNAQALYPNQFSLMESFSRSEIYEDVRLRISIPVTMWAQYLAREMEEVHNYIKDDHKIIEWKFQNKQLQSEKHGKHAIVDVEKIPGLAFTTFKSYGDIAVAYANKLRPKIVVTERVQKLADKIVADAGLNETSATAKEGGNKAVARAIYEWVVSNIAGQGSCMNTAQINPHDPDFILETHAGDCNDHAVIMQALLLAKGIESTSALLNAGGSYRLPVVPVSATFNHVINYIPALNLYVDSNSTTSPFGMLPFADEDKPVLLMDGYKDGVKTSVLAANANQQTMQSSIKIAEDGSAQGEVTVSVNGHFAANARANFREMLTQEDADVVKAALQAQGVTGTGTLNRDDPAPLRDSYKYSSKFTARNFISLPGAGALTIQPLFYNEAPISSYVGIAVQDIDAEIDTTCSGGNSSEEYIYEFPKGVKILSLPESVKWENAFLSYVASYKQQGNTVTVKRQFEDKNNGNVCTPQITSAYQSFAQKVMANLRAQIVYK